MFRHADKTFQNKYFMLSLKKTHSLTYNLGIKCGNYLVQTMEPIKLNNRSNYLPIKSTSTSTENNDMIVCLISYRKVWEIVLF